MHDAEVGHLVGIHAGLARFDRKARAPKCSFFRCRLSRRGDLSWPCCASSRTVLNSLSVRVQVMTLVGSWAGVGETDSVVRQGASSATSGGMSSAVAPATPMHPRRWLSFPAPAPRKSRSGSLVLSALAPPRLQKVSANRARGPDQEKKATTVCRSCLSRGLEITALTVPFNYTETYCQKYLVLELSRGG